MKNKIKNIAIPILEAVMLILMVFIAFLGSKHIIETQLIKDEKSLEIKENTSVKVISEVEIYEKTLLENDETISFFASTFQINKEILINKLRQDYSRWAENHEDSFDKYLIDYLLDLEKSNQELFNKQKKPCQDSKEYMVALINYYTNIYNEVDFNIASGIAEVESGFKASSMLKNNNIYGGMANGNIIKYKNIEYGILQYIKLLNDGYFTKGLTTIEAIGKVYNPTYNEKGIKIAKPAWVANVTNASANYTENENIDINLLNSLKKSS